ncbi:GNAT family N-acetyltransferase [Goodfellowiella coeruleoviolacea]|uniref:Acetyltransferase (GNAT) family protein n=1 Tax=Goodfellowiella coeruleoviolacea TaxID=334858 RepID=A0AAE3GBP5_9PSEU|nr:GNAT family N-acetyltransferase [Goodfellowiella coeruleoviolacea]MCP2165341.1 Acetyltransferase (GNAT) family protein [Goodfellowiella coeruleoviolacea]
MTTAPSPHDERLVELSATDLQNRLGEALELYVAAMGYPPGTVEQRAPMWLAHMMREDWRCVAVLDANDALLGICYGYRGAPGQWWHEQVRRGLVSVAGPVAADEWLRDYFELTELHVRPDAQGHGLGGDLLRGLLREVSSARVLLSTPEGPTRAWRLYRRLGFTDVLRHYRFTGDPRPFAVLGRTLPV